MACRCIWLLSVLFWAGGLRAQSAMGIVETYLRISLKAQDSSRLVLKETYTLNKSSDSEYKKKYLSQREEFDAEGRSSLHLYYDAAGDMQSKIIRFYPAERREKGVFQQRGGAIDSVVYTYNEKNWRLSEYWTWGDNGTVDTVRYKYNVDYNLVGVWFNYLGKSKRDSLMYREGYLDKVWTFDGSEKLQREMEFFYLNGALLKITHRNAKRLILEEEFFFYNSAGRVERTMTKIYPEDEIAAKSPPSRESKHKYHRNGNRKSTIIRDYDGQKKLIGSTQMTFDKYGNMTYLFLHSPSAGVYEKTWFVYTRRRK